MTLMVGKRVKIEGGDFDSNLAVTADAPAWSGATGYVVGDRVIRQRSSDLQWLWYEAIQAGTNQDPNTTTGTYWVLISHASRSIPFDDMVSQSPAAVSGHYYWRVIPSSVIVQYVGVFGAGGDELRITRLENTFDGITMNEESEKFDDTTYFTMQAASISANTAAEPLTSMIVADTVIESTATAEHGYGSAASTYSFTSGLSYIQFMYVKRASGSRNWRMQFPPAAFPASCNTIFTLSGAGSVSNSGGCVGTITALSDSWYLCLIVATANATATTTWGNHRLISGVSTVSYTGDGTSGIYIHGLNIVQASTQQTYYCKFAGQAYLRSVLKTHEFEYATVLYPGAEAYNPTVFVATGSQPSAGYEVQVTKNSVDNRPKIGEIAFLYDVESLGDMIEPLEDSLLDFSVKTRDDFGNVALIPRNTADDINYTFYMTKADRNRVKSVLKSRRGQPLVFFRDDDLENDLGVMNFGFINGYNMPLLPSDVQIVSLDTEGLT